jgi:hypothetical protein
LIPTIQEAAKKDGYKRKDLKAAKKEITVKTWRKPYTDDWYWYLPEDEKNLPV